MKHFGRRELQIALLIVAATTALIVYKINVLGYTMTNIAPEKGYFVELTMDVSGNGNDCDIRVTLPLETERQSIKYERESSEGDFRYSISPGRIGRWRAKDYSGSSTINFAFFAQAQEKVYTFDESAAIPTEYPEARKEDLGATERIQADDPLIQAKALELAPKGVNVGQAVRSIYDYCHKDISFLKINGPTDAITAMRLGEASCNGKNRLMIALLRASGIPARMTNGLILEKNRKRTTHAWTEIWLDGQWVPFCPTNDYFAKIPESYLELAKGDVAVFTHSPHIGFDWAFAIRHSKSHSEDAFMANARNPLNVLNTWASLKEFHISLDLIMIILLIPLGATVVSFSRNVIGVMPYGTFMPALIGAAFRDTGLLLGAAFFFVIIIISAAANGGMRNLRLLHIPRLVIVITLVVMCILMLPVGWLKLGLSANAAGVSFFPLAILSLTGERFMQTILEDGMRDALKRMFVTFLIAGFCYVLYNLSTLQNLIVAFPEILFYNIAANVLIGSWTGLRVMEYFRFRDLSLHTAEGSGKA